MKVFLFEYTVSYLGCGTAKKNDFSEHVTPFCAENIQITTATHLSVNNWVFYGHTAEVMLEYWPNTYGYSNVVSHSLVWNY